MALYMHDNVNTASEFLQQSLVSLQTWFLKRKIKLNEERSRRITFALKEQISRTVSLSNKLQL